MAWTLTASGAGVTAAGALGASAVETLQSAVEETAAALTPFVKDAAPVAHGLTFSGAPITGGALRASLQWEIGTLGAVLLGRGTGEFVIGGTVPHPIVARNTGALAFWSQAMGRGILRKRVQHPGTAPNDFRQTALAAATNATAVTDTLDRVLAAWIDTASTGG